MATFAYKHFYMLINTFLYETCAYIESYAKTLIAIYYSIKHRRNFLFNNCH